jgi:hypothetical protein
MKLLLNGCSFMDNYYYALQFNQLLGADTVNIARAGSSNRRIIRTTVDYIEQNPVDFVVLGLTFYDRQEGPFANKHDPWVSYNSQGIQAVFSNIEDYESAELYNQLGKYVLSRYRYDINEHYLDQLYLDLRMLAGYLKSKNIGFCIFNTCDRHHRNIDLGPGFVPFDFIGNEYMVQNGVACMEADKDLPQNARHHYGEDAIILVHYLVNKIKNDRSEVHMSLL